MKKRTKQAARGKWDGILKELVGESAISRKHTECPMCGGKDRYRYDNNRNDGDWFCNHCGVGDGFKLLMEVLNIGFSEAAHRVDRIVGTINEVPFQPRVDTETRRSKMNDVWAAAEQPYVAYDYLVGRGIPSKIVDQVGSDIRGIKSLDLYDGKCCVGQYGAMLALIRNKDGTPVSIHRTYLTPEGKQKKIMPPIETINGGYVRLGEPKSRLLIAEGIETALAGWCLTGEPAWATISAHGMKLFDAVPQQVQHVTICCDHDASFTGQAAAFKLAYHLKCRRQLDVRVIMPKVAGHDMLDTLQFGIGQRDYHIFTGRSLM